MDDRDGLHDQGRRWRRRGRAVLLAAVAVAASGCGRDGGDRHRRDAPSADVFGRAEAALASGTRFPGGARYRGLVAWRQATPGQVAVCGQVSPFADDRAVFVPFVSVLAAGQARPVAQFVGTSPVEADRVYEAWVEDCYADGGRPPSPASATPIPPVPSAPPSRVATSAAIAAPIAPLPSAAAAPAASPPGTVTMRQAGTLRAAPRGRRIGVMQAGTVLRVFATAPGGWLEVGRTAPEGWVYGSLTAE